MNESLVFYRSILWNKFQCSTYLRVADKAGMVARNVNNINIKHSATKYGKYWQDDEHIVLAASYELLFVSLEELLNACEIQLQYL